MESLGQDGFALSIRDGKTKMGRRNVWAGTFIEKRKRGSENCGIGVEGETIRGGMIV